jgi:hypothetical protein
MTTKKAWDKAWESASKQADDLSIELDGPPCAECFYWQPGIELLNGNFDGITLCHAEDMHGDFSCFRERNQK